MHSVALEELFKSDKWALIMPSLLSWLLIQGLKFSKSVIIWIQQFVQCTYKQCQMMQTYSRKCRVCISLFHTVVEVRMPPLHLFEFFSFWYSVTHLSLSLWSTELLEYPFWIIYTSFAGLYMKTYESVVETEKRSIILNHSRAVWMWWV